MSTCMSCIFNYIYVFGDGFDKLGSMALVVYIFKNKLKKEKNLFLILFLNAFNIKVITVILG